MTSDLKAEDVQGFMPAAGLDVLRGLAAGRRVLEIGCWKGRTAIAMAEVAQSVWSIDHFQGDAYAGRAHTLPEAWANVLASGLPICVLAGSFLTIMPRLDLTQFDLLFYDGDHDYQPTRDFLALAVQRCRPDALLVIDDYSPAYPQVKQAVADVAHDRGITIDGALCILEPIA